MPDYPTTAAEELAAAGLTWCRGCRRRIAHREGRVVVARGTVHYSGKAATRASLLKVLFLAGYGAAPRAGGTPGEEMQAALDWALGRLRARGVRIPRRAKARLVGDVAYWRAEDAAERRRVRAACEVCRADPGTRRRRCAGCDKSHRCCEMCAPRRGCRVSPCPDALRVAKELMGET